jgi:hypothetical protein
MNLLAWRKSYGFGRVEAVVLALYAALLALAIPSHEPWADEAQAWVLARDSTFWQIFRYRLHYEGTPALWHFLLRSLYLAHVPWTAVGWCCGVIAVAGVAVWLRWSPFPLAVRVLLPFSFFVLYQYGVVVRSYVLFPLLLFGLCALYCATPRRLVWFALVAGLLANLCLQGAIVSGLFALLYAWEIYRTRAPRRQLAAASLLLVTAWIICIYTAMPAPDVGFAVQDQVSGGVVHRLLVKFIGESPRSAVVRPVDTPIAATTVQPAMSFKDSPKQWVAAKLQEPAKGSALDATTTSTTSPIKAAAVTLLELMSELLWPIAGSSLLGCVFLAALLLWARIHSGLIYFIPAAVLWLVGEFLWTTDHHAGMLLLTLIAGMWITSRRCELAGVVSRETMAWRKATWLDGGFVLLLSLVLVFQIVWSISAITKDHRGTYDPGPQTAQFLRQQPSGKRIAAFHYWSVAVQPYFTRNPFFNMPTAYWQWSANVFPDALHKQTLDTHPDIVLYSQEQPLADEMRNQIVPLNAGLKPIDPVLSDIMAHGYRETHRFCGERFSRLSASFRVCDVVFEAGK